MRCSSSSTVGFFRFEALCGGGAALGTVSSARAAEPASKTLNANVAQKYSLVFRGACTLFIVVRSSHSSRESTAELGYRLSERAGTNIPSSAYTGKACLSHSRVAGFSSESQAGCAYWHGVSP